MEKNLAQLILLKEYTNYLKLLKYLLVLTCFFIPISHKTNSLAIVKKEISGFNFSTKKNNGTVLGIVVLVIKKEAYLTRVLKNKFNH